MAIIKLLTAFLITNFVIIVQTNLIPCETETDCNEFKNATCFENYCKCSNNKDCQETNYTVVMTIGSPCNEDAACNVEGGICNQSERKCICKPGMVAAFNERKCLNVADGIGSHCIESVQCYKNHPFSGCQQNKCTCQQHAHEHNGSCYQDVALGGVCSIDANCSATEHSKCIHSKCECENSFVQSGNRCLPISKSVKDACTVDEQCVASLGGASFCDNGFCSCKELYQLKVGANKCVRDMLLDEVCEHQSDCHGPRPGESRLECILGVCKCRSYFIEEYGYCISGGKTICTVPLMLILIVDVFLLIF